MTRRSLWSFWMVVSIMVISGTLLHAGSLDPAAPPGEAGSEMYTLEQVYNRLKEGAVEDASTAFDEPDAAPGESATHNINDIMGVAPAPDNDDGAGTGDVVAGKTFWGLRTDGAWGKKRAPPPNGSKTWATAE